MKKNSFAISAAASPACAATALSRRIAPVLLLCCCCAVSVTWISGCGSSNGSGGTGAGNTASKQKATGGATFKVVWPTRAAAAASARLIPADANSIQVTVTAGDSSTAATQLVARPAAGAASSTVNFPSLYIGSYTVTATAYPNTDGTGVAQAVGSVPMTISANQNTSFTLTLGTTIDHLTLSPANSTIASGTTETLIATAYDASAEIVLLSAGEIAWSVASGTAATVNPASGLVTAGSGVGVVTIAATDQETASSSNPIGGTTTVTVVPAPTPKPGSTTVSLQ